ncbi:MAG: cation transporter, partial [Bacteroidia bacterium]|nr:cation transporter [Bacteroidia bacterium]
MKDIIDTNHNHCNHNHSDERRYSPEQLRVKMKKTGWVLLISIVTTILEISYGYITNSMSLLSDGYHMASHVIAIGAGWLAYQYVIFHHNKGNHVHTSKTLSYVGFFNALALAIIAVLVFIESVE